MTTAAGRLRELGNAYSAVKPDHYYDRYAEHLRVDPETVEAVLELGVHGGGSVLMWADYFQHAQIFGVDYAPMQIAGDHPRIHLLQANQMDTGAIGRFLQANGVNQLDLIIDDCSHLGYATKQSFWFLFDSYLKPGGYFIIEDWGTGYLEAWPDGAKVVQPDSRLEEQGIFGSHDRGIPGFVKQVVDHTLRYESIVLTAGLVIIKKQSIENAAALARATRLWEDGERFSARRFRTIDLRSRLAQAVIGVVDAVIASLGDSLALELDFIEKGPRDGLTIPDRRCVALA